MLDRINVQISYVEFDPNLAVNMDNRGTDLLVSKDFIFCWTDFNEAFFNRHLQLRTRVELIACLPSLISVELKVLLSGYNTWKVPATSAICYSVTSTEHTPFSWVSLLVGVYGIYVDL